MPQKGRRRSEEKREQILCAAMSLFMEQGYEGTSMDMIAERAEVSKQTVYSHFQGKEDLFTTAIRRKCISHELSDNLFADERPCAEVLTELGRRFIRLMISEDAVRVLRLCIAGAEQHSQVADLFFASGPQRLIESVSAYLQCQHERGRLRVDNPRFAATQFLFMVKAEAHLRALLNLGDPLGQEQHEAYLQSCVAMFMRAYQAHGPSSVDSLR